VTYTTHGYMTPADMAEYRYEYDLDLCSECEAGSGCSEHDEVDEVDEAS
jgi:hypothetical protein